MDREAPVVVMVTSDPAALIERSASLKARCTRHLRGVEEHSVAYVVVVVAP